MVGVQAIAQMKLSNNTNELTREGCPVPAREEWTLVYAATSHCRVLSRGVTCCWGEAALEGVEAGRPAMVTVQVGADEARAELFLRNNYGC